MTCNNSGQCQRYYGQGWTYSQGLTMANSNVSIVLEVVNVLPVQGKVDIMKLSIDQLNTQRLCHGVTMTYRYFPFSFDRC